MTTTEIRDLVLFGALVLGLLLMTLRSRPGPVSPVVEQLHQRIASVEQQVTQLPDHAMRIRTMEREVGEVRGALKNLIDGQGRMNSQLDMVVQHIIDRERSAP